MASKRRCTALKTMGGARPIGERRPVSTVAIFAVLITDGAGKPASP
ncbi:hypothetical protein MBEBAB_0122 [Brevundimonas abyssalis TAR-001]|uniref:Uncharacterized protein n=1 Tax=Brevundimonas abyssalis TAR-001 TaxID=1391729 RepID=A0A8E0KK11_9CAUL|nr:hypothetical protein MBEBAB_0122 [Brevundimonas abyssalis TAR-001]